jgi:methylenetetrahydrofolate--tRNA-(uracil-5-)-methyltransferase
MKSEPGVFWAGQITGVEGYVESAAMGLVAGMNVYSFLKGDRPLVFPPETAIGSLVNYITTGSSNNFQPMNINFGLFPQLPTKVAKKNRKEMLSKRSLEELSSFRKKFHLLLAY